MSTLEIPLLPDPVLIRREIDALRARIVELKALLPLSKTQHAARDSVAARQLVKREGAND